LKVKIEVGLKF